jgi:hypothetical protein
MIYYPSMKSLLPIILLVLALTGAITYSLAKKATQVKKDVNRFGISANQLETNTVPKFKFNTDNAPTPSAPVVIPTVKPIATPTASPSAMPQITTTETGTDTKGGQVVAGSDSKPSTVKTTVCTPVYGMANTCTEHVVVDTGAADSIFFNLAGLSYVGGLVALVKAKTLKK